MKNFNYLERQKNRKHDNYHDYWKKVDYSTFNPTYGYTHSDDSIKRLTIKIRALQNELKLDMSTKRFKKLTKRLKDITTEYPELMI